MPLVAIVFFKQERMERRRREWEQEVERMRSDFFKLKPIDARRGSSENLLESRPLSDIFYDDARAGNKKFCVSFDVSEFRPEEISVRTQDSKLLVHAKHEERGDGRSLSREFSRTVDVPKHVDAKQLSCCLSNDGVLQVEAAVAAPQYDKIEESVARNTNAGARPGPVVVQHDGSQKFRIILDIGSDYLPQDVVVKTVDKKLVLSARHEEKGEGRSSIKSLSREFDLPESVDPNTVTASMTGDGKLVLEAPISNYAHGSYTGRPGSTKQPTVTIAMGK